MRIIRLIATAAGLGLAAMSGTALAQTAAPPMPTAGSTADHSKFDILKKAFASGPEVTEACLSCHTEADNQVQMHSIHFDWEFDHPDTGQKLGKRNVINSFCGSVAGNEPRCTSCHAGYGWTDMNQPPPQQSNAVDCLVCHDRSGNYTKLATGAGHPPMEAKGTTITGAKAWAVDLSKAAQSVGMPGRDNCGNCHFYGGGGDNVKHGDLSSALYNPAHDVDVHMSAKEDGGEGMVCATCHVSDQHKWAGSRYDVQAADNTGLGKPGARRDVATCQSCHGTDPHPANIKGVKLNDHTDKLACQTCHIPSFARGGVPTKTLWDWSTAGKLKDGKPYSEENFTSSTGQHLHTYMSTKGNFDYGEDVMPYYAWFDGQVEYSTIDRKIDPSQTVNVNSIKGDPASKDSRIWPFKRMEGRQAYDTVNNTLVYTHVWGPKTDTAFWTNFDWGKAVEAGMKAANQPYSGQFGFVDTYMYWPITHMVAPAESAVDCAECHARDGRLQNIAGVFMPGTDPNGPVGILGKLIVLAALAGVLMHGVLRLFSSKKGGRNG
ncbi:tetrathionate reductase family octaheme c-type cytochrome [Thalassovita sp.]|uniref:tetrathionate reductase family octaheme c-type cytochrome n=1 Tax=Thalassovita sp. TaxID=1979401 RepID=UPI0029DE827C|nr:tetrathionate reductase family octaheme c-type cytochrome [Thalassovita sp.]